jgi:hypothetical protein
MKISVRVKAIVSLAVVTAFLPGPRWAGAEPASVTGQWEATVLVNGVEVPCRFEIATAGGVLAGSFFNGDRRITSTASRLEGDRLHFAFDQYAAELDAAIDDGKLVGEYRRGVRVAYPFKAICRTSAGRRRFGKHSSRRWGYRYSDRLLSRRPLPVESFLRRASTPARSNSTV